MRQDSGSRKSRQRAQLNPQAAPELVPAPKTPPPTCDETSESSGNKCSKCGVILEPTAKCCLKCDGVTEEGRVPNPVTEKRSFKPYANIRSPLEKALYETVVETFSEMDPRQRPWCGIGLEPGLLAVSPTGLTVADLREVNGVQEGIVQVPRNWREAWYVKTADGARHQIERNPCEQAERVISTIKAGLRSSCGDGPRFPCIKYLITFPDRYEISGPNEFSILYGDDVLTLAIGTFRVLVEAIVQPAQEERLDSRNYRAWIHNNLLRTNDDSIVGTWLDPAFDIVEADRPARRRWPFLHIRHQKGSAEEKELSRSNTSQTRLRETRFNWRKSKVTLIVSGILIAMIGWRLNDETNPTTAVSDSGVSLPAPDAETRVNVVEDVQAAISQGQLSLPENENQDMVPVMEVGKSGDVQNAESTVVKKPRDRTQDGEDSELKRQKMEVQIQQAIRRRAISGVTVHIMGNTAYLEGQVATENQKSAAEKAARSVPGVRDVQSSIEVHFSPATDG